MQIIGTQLSVTAYQDIRLAMAQQLPHLAGRVQTINAGGRFVVNGSLSEADANTIKLLHAAQPSATVDAGFDMLAHQATERRRAQTHKARAMRTARAFRFAR